MCSVKKIESDGVIDRENIQSEWVNLPLEVENQQLFSVDSTFLTKLLSVKTFKGLRKLWDCPGNGNEKINLAPIVCSDEEFIKSKAWAFSLHHLSNYVLPNNLEFRTVDGILSKNQWFTEGHIELCGDDSISATLFGKKLFMYAKRGRPSKFLVQTIKSGKDMRELIEKGPPSMWEEDWFVSIPQSTSFIIQPALTAHSVLTMSAPALVAGWEAGDLSDTARFPSVRSTFAFGLGQEYHGRVRELSSVSQRKVVGKLHGDVGALLNRELESGNPTKTVKRPKKRTRWSHLCNVRKSEEIKLKTKES